MSFAWPWRDELAGEAATARLAEDVAACLRRGDAVALRGELGAGKTAFARAVIRALANDTAVEVPSPTYTLVQTYPTSRFAVAHYDLYRLSAAGQVAELGLADALADGVVLIEWPEIASALLPASTLTVQLDGADESRTVTLSGGADWAARIERSFAIRAMLDGAGWEGAERRYLQGDASARTYERVRRGAITAVVMNSPARADGPPVRAGRPYSRIAHLAEDVRPFVAVAEALRANGFSAPEIFAADMAGGLLLLEDLGSEGIVESGVPKSTRYVAAIECLADLHRMARPNRLPFADGTSYTLPDFDDDALGIEVSLVLDWYAPHVLGQRLAVAAEESFYAAWSGPFRTLLAGERNWVLRDYHSPNLLWLAGRRGPRRVGLLDFQDAVIGPTAYDVASLAQDARVTVSEALETDLVTAYIAARRAQNPAFSETNFRAAYAIAAAQRATKILGIFARLANRDGKPGYLAHIPRVMAYLRRALRHPVLSPVALWYEENLPLAG
ncbi:MAG: tRNA (adenosine(37)-N6)-threonylcarbamoyltransferase complex ATPase subunit type 1 TsaE [Bauldia sp.]